MAKQRPPSQNPFTKFNRLPPQELVFRRLGAVLEKMAVFYGFERIHLSLLEEPRALLPLVKVGLCDERSPVLGRTRSGVEFALRFSGALSILRAYVTQKMNDLPHPLKIFFDGDSFFLDSLRGKEIHARPEWGLVMIGEEGPIAEAEIVQIVWKALVDAGVKGEDMEIRVNAIGCSECRPVFRSQLGSYLRNRSGRLCKSCKRHLKRMPTRVLGCEEEKCKIVSSHTPQILDFLCDLCKKHLRGFMEFLDEIRAPYFLDSRLFREGSPFSTIIFEFAALPAPNESGERKRSASIFGEGGRLSRAGEIVAGKRLDVASATLYLNEVAAIHGRSGTSLFNEEGPKIFLAQLGELAKRKSLGLLEILRKSGIDVRESLGRDSVKSQLKFAEHYGAEVALILGQKEALDNTIIVREVESGIQETLPQEKLIEFLKKKLKRP